MAKEIGKGIEKAKWHFLAFIYESNGK